MAINYDPNAAVDDGGCVSIIPGCMNSRSRNYNSIATLDDRRWYILGCDEHILMKNEHRLGASNFDETANAYDGSCIM
eukprot:1026781-Pleurochrysis_carterae.AAC.1